MDYKSYSDPICPDGYPDCIDPEILKIGDVGLDPKDTEPIVMDDYRIDKTKPDFTYIMPHDPDISIDPPTLESIRMGNEMLNDTWYDDDPNNAFIYEDPKGPFLSLVAKYEWGGIYPRHRPPLRAPVRNVRFHYTGTDTDRFPECIGIIKDLQTKFVEKEGFTDIPYNFLIGSDGQLYEGTGWYVDAEMSPDDKNLKGNCLEIAYVGDFKNKPPSWEMLETGVEVLRYGLETANISPQFRTIPYQSDVR